MEREGRRMCSATIKRFSLLYTFRVFSLQPPPLLRFLHQVRPQLTKERQEISIKKFVHVFSDILLLVECYARLAKTVPTQSPKPSPLEPPHRALMIIESLSSR